MIAFNTTAYEFAAVVAECIYGGTRCALLVCAPSRHVVVIHDCTVSDNQWQFYFEHDVKNIWQGFLQIASLLRPARTSSVPAALRWMDELFPSISIAINLAGCVCGSRKRVYDEDIVVMIQLCALDTMSRREITELVQEFCGNSRPVPFPQGVAPAKTLLNQKYPGKVFFVTRHI